jgi:Domain of unknown function (DUF4160)
MAEIKRFGGFKLLMFFQDENPPHVHVKGPDFAAKIRLSNGELIAGQAPGKALRQARRWIVANRERLLDLWNEFQG